MCVPGKDFWITLSWLHSDRSYRKTLYLISLHTRNLLNIYACTQLPLFVNKDNVFSSLLTFWMTKLECLLAPNLFSLVSYQLVKREPTREEHLTLPLLRITSLLPNLTLPNVRLGCKSNIFDCFAVVLQCSKWRHDTRHIGTLPNDIQHNNKTMRYSA